MNRELYLPTSWTDDTVRCRAAGIPDDVGFQTKPQLAQGPWWNGPWSPGVPFGWVIGDTVYDGDCRLGR